jgi:hypothetical protein
MYPSATTAVSLGAGKTLGPPIEFALVVVVCVLGVLALKRIVFRLAMILAARVVRRRGQNNH